MTARTITGILTALASSRRRAAGPAGPGRLPHADAWGGGGAGRASEKDVKLTQKLGQLHLFVAVYFHRNAWANFHILGQPNAVLAAADGEDGGRAAAGGLG